MNWLDALANLLRRARLRGLTEGQVQTVRAEALEHDAKDQAERWQDYGFAANPVDGHGLVINAGGHTVVIRMDRLAERPQLAAHEVAIWHKSGSRVVLRDGQVVDVICAELNITASTRVQITSPSVQVTAAAGVTMTTPTLAASAAITAASSLQVAGVEVAGHDHGGVAPGGSTTDPMA